MMPSPPAPVPPPRKRHRVRNAVLGVTGGIVVLGALGAALGGHSTPPARATASSPQVTAPATASPAAATTAPAPAPAPPPAPPRKTVLLRMSGNGIQNSAPFLVTSGTLTVRYSYDCAAFGQSGNFIADIETADQGLSGDDQQAANVLANGGSAVTTIYPQDTGSEYHLSVNSECSWSVTVKQDG